MAVESPQRFLREMRMDEMLQSVPGSAWLYQTVELYLRDKKLLQQLADGISQHLHDASPQSDAQSSGAHALMQQRRWQEAVNVWMPLHPEAAEDCVQCAIDLHREGQSALARQLFGQIAQVAPAISIRYGYQFLQHPSMAETVLSSIEPLLPTGEETELSQHQRLAIRLFVRHSPNYQQIFPALRRLVEYGVLDKEDFQLLTEENYQRLRRDEEIEAYLKQHLPTLRTGNFFSAMQERQPKRVAGKRTNLTAKNVVQRPGMMGNPPSHDPSPIRKKI